MEDLAMKKILLSFGLIVILLFSFSLKASELTLRVYDNSLFDLVFDSESFYDIDGTISFQNVSPGKHYLKVMKYRINPNGYIVGIPKIIFEGMIHIRSGRSIFAMIDHYGRYIIEDEYVLHSNYPPVPPPVYMPPYMNEADFAALKMTIDRLSFDSSKLNMVKQASSTNVLTCSQVFEIMMLFSFESSKLEFAKHAFHNVYDKNRYYLVNNAFTFSSSIASLNRYIGQFN